RFDSQSSEMSACCRLRVARFFQENREEVLVASASALASKIGTSDATVVRATKALGIGPSSAMADYFAIQLGRFGIVSASLTVGIDRHLPAPFLTTAATASTKHEQRTQRTRGPQPLSGSRPPDIASMGPLRPTGLYFPGLG